MEKYGTIFESNFNLGRDQFQTLIVEYFNDPNLEKIKNSETAICSQFLLISKLNKFLH